MIRLDSFLNILVEKKVRLDAYGLSNILLLLTALAFLNIFAKQEYFLKLLILRSIRKSKKMVNSYNPKFCD